MPKVSFEDNIETSNDFTEKSAVNEIPDDDFTENTKDRSDLTNNHHLETIQKQNEEIENLKKQMTYLDTIEKQKQEIANLKKQLQLKENLLKHNVNNEPIEKEDTTEIPINQSSSDPIPLEKANEVVENENVHEPNENGLDVIANLKYTAQGPRIVLQGIEEKDYTKDEMKKINMKVAEKFMKALKDAKLNGQTPPCQVKVKILGIRRQ